MKCRDTIELGSVHVALSGEASLLMLRHSDAFRPFFSAGGNERWHIVMDVPFSLPDGMELLSAFPFEDNLFDCRFCMLADTFFFVMSKPDGSVGVALRHERNSSLVELTPSADYQALKFAIWFAISLLSSYDSVTFVHSSTVVCHGRAVMFLGDSGTGKSTHSRLWLKHIDDSSILNDDSPMLSLRDGTAPVVYGSPWSGKEPHYLNRHYPLAAIVRLSQAAQNDIRHLSAVESFVALQPSLPPALMQSGFFADLLMPVISSVVATVPFYRLQCLPDADAAHMCHSSVFPEL